MSGIWTGGLRPGKSSQQQYSKRPQAPQLHLHRRKDPKPCALHLRLHHDQVAGSNSPPERHSLQLHLQLAINVGSQDAAAKAAAAVSSGWLAGKVILLQLAPVTGGGDAGKSLPSAPDRDGMTFVLFAF